MDTRNGRIYDDFQAVPLEARPPVVPMAVQPTPLQIKRRRVGRNDPCPCGSEKKFKRCCLQKQSK